MMVAESKGLRGYKDPANPVWVPAVGTVLDVLCGPMSNWIDEEALNEGWRCHAMTANALRSGELLGWTDVPATLRVFPLCDWLKREGFTPVEVETTHYSKPYGYAGTLDAILKRDDGLWIPDWKFAESLDMNRYTVQLTAYGKLIGKVKGLLLVQVTRAGEVKPKVIHQNPANWAAFLGALSVLRWRLAH